jgi:threonine/homoserine/homoserine lactone efflux protein
MRGRVFRLSFNIRVDPLLAAYLSTTFLLAITPGATTAVVVRNTLGRGMTGGLAAAGGAATGNTIQAAIAGMGVAVLFAKWPLLAAVLRTAGALYLLWLGAASLRRGFRLRPAGALAAPGMWHAGSAYRQGLTVNLLNPAITSFYVAVVPAFVPPAAPPWHYAALAAAHVLIAFACHAAWAVAFGWLRQGAERPRLMRGLEVAAGLVLVALAIKVMASV